eukprot:TRINITY_DN785_c0_g1_i1.p1 TRINITY_DN785_c0_g1~~TRINITY_DN785_c0_g1_i1.p1  ORF type:complete len:293 (+),score=43.81 TRINITY_DN785_c0_g1_i1:64-942(+)
MALYFDVRQKHKEQSISPENLEKQLREAIDQIVTVLIGVWPPRFCEIEWPAMIWLNWMVGFGEHVGLDLWPKDKVPELFRVPKLRLDLVVAMSWDTDFTDIDLHVHEPDGAHVYYGARNSASGGHISRDFRQGYGPECYLVKRALTGVYNIHAQYFCSAQASASTGTTSCVLWTVQWLGHYDEEVFGVKMIRLDTNSHNMRVMSVDVGTTEEALDNQIHSIHPTSQSTDRATTVPSISSPTISSPSTSSPTTSSPTISSPSTGSSTTPVAGQQERRTGVFSSFVSGFSNMFR